MDAVIELILLSIVVMLLCTAVVCMILSALQAIAPAGFRKAMAHFDRAVERWVDDAVLHANRDEP